MRNAVPYLEQVKAFFAADRFAAENGCEILEAGDGYALCALTVADRHINAAGLVQGGAIYTLGDFAFAVAANSCGKCTVSLNIAVSYSHGVKGSVLYAEAKKTSDTRRMCFYQVRLFDELATEVAQMQVTGYIAEKDNGLRYENESDE